VFLLSDGIDTFSKNRIIRKNNDGSLFPRDHNFTIHTFGFGNDHDPELMTSIADLRDGNFYYIENLDLIDACFVDALGGLFSVVGENVIIQLSLSFKAPFVSHKISKTYGKMWKFDET
jgi:hypothetical protein